MATAHTSTPPMVLAESVCKDFGALKPVAMERTLQLLESRTGIARGRFTIPCDANGAARHS